MHHHASSTLHVLSNKVIFLENYFYYFGCMAYNNIPHLLFILIKQKKEIKMFGLFVANLVSNKFKLFKSIFKTLFKPSLIFPKKIVVRIKEEIQRRRREEAHPAQSAPEALTISSIAQQSFALFLVVFLPMASHGTNQAAAA
jgi:hypothetical protein